MLTEEQVGAVLSYEELIPVIRQALMDFFRGRVRQPLRNIIPVPEYGGWFGVMPAVYGTVMGAKMVAFYPGNAGLEKHTHMAMIQLFRADTGEPLVTMDGRLITEMRTAAVSAVADRSPCFRGGEGACYPGQRGAGSFAYSRTSGHSRVYGHKGMEPVASARAGICKRDWRAGDERGAGGLRCGCGAGADQFAGADPPREMAKSTRYGLCYWRGDPGAA